MTRLLRSAQLFVFFSVYFDYAVYFFFLFLSCIVNISITFSVPSSEWFSPCDSAWSEREKEKEIEKNPPKSTCVRDVRISTIFKRQWQWPQNERATVFMVAVKLNQPPLITWMIVALTPTITRYSTPDTRLESRRHVGRIYNRASGKRATAHRKSRW